MAQLNKNIHVAVAAIGGAKCADLVGAMRRAGWKVLVTDNIQELVAQAESGNHHAAILACDRPDDLPRAPMRELLSMHADISVQFLTPQPDDLPRWPALAGATSDQVHSLSWPTEKIIDLLNAELASVVACQPRYTIICVDDDREFLASLEHVLPSRLAKMFPRFNLNFDYFSSSEEALKAVEQIPPGRLAVAICDQVMPDMTGLELLIRVKAIRPGTQRVLLTGYAGLDSAIAAINSQVLDKYLAKPVEQPVVFANAVGHLLRTYHLRKAAESHRERVMSQFEFIRAMSATFDMDTSFNTAVGFLCEQTGNRDAAVLLLEGDSFVVRASSCPQSGDWLHGHLKTHNGPEWLLQHRRPTTVTSDADLPFEGGPAKAPLLAVPLIRGETPLGMILVTNQRVDGSFTRSQQMMLSFVADAAALTAGALHNREQMERHYVDTMGSRMEAVKAKDQYARGHADRIPATGQ